MISSDKLTEIGHFNKPHGIKGELSATIDSEDVELNELPCIFIEFDGLMIPFFIASLRPKGPETSLVTIDGIDDEKKASEFSNKAIFARTADLPDTGKDDDDILYLEDLCGFKLFDGENEIGIIEDYDDSTENILLIVSSSKGKTIYIPASEDFITDIDEERKCVTMSLPIGLTEL